MQWVPLLVNRPLDERWTQRLKEGKVRNFDLFDMLLNGVVPAEFGSKPTGPEPTR
eukprot:SAG11_NODE_28734_length_318_cov_1.173516_1_plen_55_part_00